MGEVNLFSWQNELIIKTALLKASEIGHVEIVEYLIQTAHANVTYADTDGWTALHNASAKGYCSFRNHPLTFIAILKSLSFWFTLVPTLTHRVVLLAILP
jgi:hypothetical protein